MALEDIPAADLVVVGGGVAGWTAALRASERGLRVVVLEQAEHDVSGGNALLSGGVFHAAYHDPDRPPQELASLVRAKVDGCARDDVVLAWSRNVRRARDFLAAHGGRFFRARPEEQFWNVLDPFRAFVAPTARDLVGNELWRGMGPHRLLQAMHDEFVAAGGMFVGGARAQRIRWEDGVIRGVEAERSSGDRLVVDTGAVVLSDGGFQANSELVARHITPAYRLRGSTAGSGACLGMALELGAMTANMGSFYGHVLVRDALHNERLWPDPSPESIIDEGIVVDAYGRRFVDESRTDEERATFSDKVAGAVARSATPDGCWVVFDERVWREQGQQGSITGLLPSISSLLASERATVLCAETVEALAAEAGLPEGELVAAVTAFNRLYTEGVTPTPPRSGRPQPLTAPFYAIPLIVGITFTMGGPLVDGHGRVLDENERPIAGLYAAGGAMAGLHGGPRNGYAGGWSEAATFGLLAGEHASDHVAEELCPTCAIEVRSDD